MHLTAHASCGTPTHLLLRPPACTGAQQQPVAAHVRDRMRTRRGQSPAVTEAATPTYPHGRSASCALPGSLRPANSGSLAEGDSIKAFRGRSSAPAKADARTGAGSALCCACSHMRTCAALGFRLQWHDPLPASAIC